MTGYKKLYKPGKRGLAVMQYLEDHPEELINASEVCAVADAEFYTGYCRSECRGLNNPSTKGFAIMSALEKSGCVHLVQEHPRLWKINQFAFTVGNKVCVLEAGLTK
jgi:hypothetical protein